MGTDAEVLICEKKDKVATVTMNRIEKRNAMNAELVNELRKTWIDLESDPEIRVTILTGAGKAFCTGMDLEEAGRGIRADLNACIPNFGVVVTKPTIAAINGWTIGAGMGLAMACDLKVMSENAKFIFPESKIGWAAGGIDSLKYMPYAIAMEVWLTGEPLGAKRAYEVGMVNRVVPEDQLMKEAMKFASIIRENAPLTMRMLKMIAVEHTHTVKSRWLFTEAQYIKLQTESEDFKEGIRAFKEKRKPSFSGK